MKSNVVEEPDQLWSGRGEHWLGGAWFFRRRESYLAPMRQRWWADQCRFNIYFSLIRSTCLHKEEKLTKKKEKEKIVQKNWQKNKNICEFIKFYGFEKKIMNLKTIIDLKKNSLKVYRIWKSSSIFKNIINFEKNGKNHLIWKNR